MSNKDEYQQLDARDWVCPMPLLKMRLKLNTMMVGERLRVLASDQGSWQDIPKYLNQSSHRLIEAIQEQGHYVFLVEKG